MYVVISKLVLPGSVVVQDDIMPVLPNLPLVHIFRCLPMLPVPGAIHRPQRVVSLSVQINAD